MNPTKENLTNVNKLTNDFGSFSSWLGAPKVWKSQVNPKDTDFQKKYNGMLKLLADLNEKLKLCSDQGSEEVIKRHLQKGKLLARERIELLLDEDSPFLELCPLAGYGQKNCTNGGNCVGGIGIICGVECMVYASIPTIKGGTMNKAGVLKRKRLNEIALENGLPSVELIESGGADLTQQADVFHTGGATFRESARRSKLGYPTIVCVFGSSTAGGAYIPGMADYSIFVKNQAQVYLGGPPLVKMAIGEIVDDETLGGAEMHSKISGVSDYLAQDERHAIRLAREIVRNLNYKKKTPLPLSHFSQIEEPLYDPDEILGIVGDNIRVPFDCREVIARIVDGSRFSEFKPLYGSTLITCFSRIHGIPVGILSNNGVLFSDCANKGSQFIQLCNQVNIPLLFLQNITGFMVGKKYEQEGIIKNGAKLINAISNSGVPSMTIIMGASYGAGNYGMNGREYKPRFLFSWCNSKCSVMGAEQLSGVLDIVFKNATERRGIQLDEQMLKIAEARKQKLTKQIEEESSVYYTSSRIIDDGVIDPRHTRFVVGFCLSVIYTNEVKGGNLYGTSRM